MGPDRRQRRRGRARRGDRDLRGAQGLSAEEPRRGGPLRHGLSAGDQGVQCRRQGPAAHPDIVDILAQNTALNKPELVRAIAPHWSYIADDGVPLVDSIMEMQDFWSGKYFNFVEKKVSREQLFDLNVAKEAQARLEKEKPFGN